jgi:hypothetical protein
MEAAARSMLYHRTREVARPEPLPADASITKLYIGDGWDAARGILMPDLLFGELDERRYRFAMPHHDLLLYTQEDGSEGPTRALREAAREAMEGAAMPLSASVFTLDGHRPVCVR